MHIYTVVQGKSNILLNVAIQEKRLTSEYRNLYKTLYNPTLSAFLCCKKGKNTQLTKHTRSNSYKLQQHRLGSSPELKSAAGALPGL